MVLSIVIANFMVAKELIDQGSSIDILYWKTFQRLEISPATIQPHYRPLLGFAGERVETRGYVEKCYIKRLGERSTSYSKPREVRYLTWLANVVMVRKANGKWRMCMDYTNLNKVCPKDVYPLPSISKLVDGASSFQLLSFLDAYSG